MQWVKDHIHVSQYVYTSTNQYGVRYKCTGTKRLSVAVISCESNDANGMQKLILLSNTLDVPVRYDFEEQEAYIEVVSKEALEECK